MRGAIPPLPLLFHGVALNETQGQFHISIIKATFLFSQQSVLFGPILAVYLLMALQPLRTSATFSVS
jgi:hypothetical protein